MLTGFVLDQKSLFSLSVYDCMYDMLFSGRVLAIQYVKVATGCEVSLTVVTVIIANDVKSLL